MKDKSYGVTIQNVLISEIDRCVEEIQINGYSIIENEISESDLALCREKIDKIYEIQKEKFGETNLEMISEKNLARCLLAYDDFFLKIALLKKVHEIVERFLGKYFILHLQNGIINTSGQEHHQSSWHRDLPYQNFVISRPLSINALICVDDFNSNTGSTYLLPHSHRVEFIPSDEFIKKHAIQLNAKAGSIVIFDSMLFHKAGYNSSESIRRAINNVYISPILKQQISLPDILCGKYSDDEFLSKFLGYQSETASSDYEWRMRKLNKTK